MKKLIIYGSEYGTTRTYASRFSEMTGIPVMNYEDMQSLSDYGLIIHFGGLFAGGVKGLRKTVKAMNDDTALIIVTVGLADVNDKENTDNIKKSISKQVPEKILKNTQVFHLRGGIDYSKLNFKHKTMMTLLYRKAKSLPEEKKTAEITAMIETFGKKVNFVNFESLSPIMDAVQ